MTAIERFAGHVASGARDISGPLAQCLSLHVADTVLAWVAASRTAEGRALLRFESPGSSGTQERIMRNCALARLSEIDDIHLASCTTPGSVVVPAALILAASIEAAPGAIAGAIVAGYEAMVRLGKALDGPSILYRGIWPTYICAPFGVAAACSRLLGLSERETAHALGLALALAAPGVGHQSGAAMSRWLALGHAAGNGVVAAMAAKSGFTADLKMLEGEFFPSVYRVTPEPAALTEALRERAAILDVSFKPWCAARQTMAATQALKELIAGGMPLDELTEVTVSVPPSYHRMVNHGVVPGDRSSHLTSLPYQLALGVLAPGEGYRVAQSPAALSPEIESLMSKVTVLADESLLAYYPEAWPARVSAQTRSARRESLVVHVPGDPERPFAESQVREKFLLVASPLIGEKAATDLFRASLAAFGPGPGPTALLEAVEDLCLAAGSPAEA